ncbi:MAG: hypothetical protein HUJ60_01955 [Bacilli bacterium]|nr:hypothetical protein [Bacilli bacterium]
MNHYADSQIDSCPSIGSPKILVIPVWFTNSTDYISESKKEDVRSDIEACYFGTNSDTGWHSVKSYYQTESMGKLRLDGTVSSWYECGKAVSYYGNSEDRTVSLVTEATDWYFTNNPTESRKDYDLDGNGGLDAVCLIYGAPDYSQASVGSNFWAYCYWTGEYPNINAPTANTFFWASYDFMYSSGSTARSRTGKASYGSGDTRYCTLDAHSFIHEFGHVLGLEDYYDYSGTSSPAAGFSMQDMNIGGHDPYSTMLFGWADPYVATESGEITIGAFQSTHELIVLSPQWNSYDSPFDEYLLLELYTPTGLNAFDNANNYGGAYPTGASQAGIRLWHVDGRLATYNTRTGTFSRQLTANANGSNVIFAMSNTYPNSSTQGYGSPLGSSYDNYNQLQMIRNRTSSGHKASANDYLRNADLFRSGESFDMATYGSQFVNTGKFNSSKALGWSFSVSISGSGDAAQATITLTKE